MTRWLVHGVAALLLISGSGLLVLYGMMLVHRIGEISDPRDVASVAGLGIVAVVAGALVELSVFPPWRWLQARTLCFPPVWVSSVAFVTIVLGGWASVRMDATPLLELTLAVLGVAVIFAFVGRIVIRWGPGGGISFGLFARATAWGLVAATSAAVVLQGMIALVAIAGVVGGLALADPDLLRGLAERVGREGSIEQFSGTIVDTVTVAVEIVGMYALAAPLTEEFTKLLGIMLVLRRVPPTAYGAFFTGACVGLGFSVAESLSYALAAGESWPMVLGIRAPVAFIHVTASALVALGWYQQQRRGGYALLVFYIVAVLVHGAWNGLTAAIMIASSAADTAETLPTAIALTAFGVILVMGLILTGCVAWTTLTARKLGTAWSSAQATIVVPPLVARAYGTVSVPTVTRPELPHYEV